mgnify:CR=1 FL=1
MLFKRGSSDVKMILDLNEQTIKDMQEYCDHHNITINKLITDLFVRYIKEPTATFFEIHDDNEFWDFVLLLNNYLSEAIYDIKSLSESEEAFETDEAMAKVFERLSEKHIKQAYVIMDLFKVYKEAMKNA